MERRKVRIYKAQDGQGKYINKTKQFLEKAQDGMQVSNGQDDVQEQLENVKFYIKGLKSEDIDDQDIYKVLVSKGIRKDIVSYLLEEINSEIEEEEAAAEQKENGATEEGEKQEQEMSQEETSAEEEPDQGMEYYNSYANEEDDYNPNMEYQYGGKTSKRNFTKNVLSLLKKQEGGAEKELGKGQRFDTINGDVSKKSEFVSKIKEIADKAAVDELYKKMMGSNNPELIQGAQKIAEQRNKPAMGTFQEAQSGGLVGGDKQPEMFMYGGTDIPFYEADMLPEAKRGIISGKAYNTRTKEEYKDSFEGLSPYAKTVHKRGLFGRPKQWTEYYSKGSGPGKPLTPGQEIKAAYEKQMAENKSLKHGVEKDVWDDLSGKAKREIRRGERQLGREARRGAKSLAEDAEFNKGVHARYKYNSEEDLARDQKRSEDAWNSKEKEFVSDIDYNSPYKDFVYNTHDPRGNRYEEPRVVAMPELLPYGLKEADFNISERPLQEDETSDRDMWDATTARELAQLEIQHKKDLEQADKEQAEKEANEHPLSSKSFESSLINLQNSEDSEFDYTEQKYNNLADLKQREIDYTVKNNSALGPFNDNGLYRFIPGKSKATIEEEEKLKLRYGGLPKAQTGPPAKKESDPTTTTTQFGNIMSKNNGLDGNMSMNPNNLKGMPDQLTTQFLGDPKKEDKSNNDIIAIDKQRAPSNFTGADGVNAFNVGATAITGFLNNLDTAKQEKEMYENNFTSDNMYAATNTRDRGDYVDYGQQLGQFRYDQMGSDTSGRFAYGQMGGYMQDGGFTEGDVVDMTEEELEEFLANGGEVEYL